MKKHEADANHTTGVKDGRTDHYTYIYFYFTYKETIFSYRLQHVNYKKRRKDELGKEVVYRDVQRLKTKLSRAFSLFVYSRKKSVFPR